MRPIIVQRTVPFRPEQLYDVAADIEDYPNFLTSCIATRIAKQSDNELLVDNVFRWGPVPFRFRTRALFDKPKAINIETVKGESPSLKLSWYFTPEGPMTNVQLSMALELDVPFFGGVVADMLQNEMEATERAFLKRVEDRQSSKIEK